MSSPEPRQASLYDSMATIPSDSENYDANNEESSSGVAEDSTGAPVILYSPPTVFGLLRGAAINLLLPFINGLMLGFGELMAHEVAFRWGWSQTKVFPSHRSGSRPVGPGVEMQDDPIERRRRNGQELDMYTSLE